MPAKLPGVLIRGMRHFGAAVLFLAVVAVSAAGPARIVFVAGEKSHGPGEHEFPAGCELLARALERSGLPVRTEVHVGWPADAVLAGARALVIYSDGLGSHPAAGHVPALRAHSASGGGVSFLHFATEPTLGTPLADYLLEFAGGRFEVDWSVNPIWTLEGPTLEPHEVTRGVRPFTLHDEWYYHLRLNPAVVRVLRGLPPASSLGEDGPRSGNPTVRAALRDGVPQTLAWVHVRGGARAFGTTGGHFHRSWEQPDFRRLVLNAVVWTAGLEVPEGGVSSSVVATPRHGSIDEAIARGDLEDVRRHLAFDPGRVHAGRHATLKPLQQAILRNRPEIALALLEAGADPDLADATRRTALHLAVDRGNATIVAALLAAGARPNELDQDGWTPLHHAAARDRLEVARALLDGGADVMALSARGGTPLHEAAASGGAALIGLLLERGVDPAVVSKTGVTALDVAREFNNAAALSALGADR